MASIDKIYMTKEQGAEFWAWILDHRDPCLDETAEDLAEYFYRTKHGFLTNYPESIDWYLVRNCKLGFIKERLGEQYETFAPSNELHDLSKSLIDMCGDRATEIIEAIHSFSEHELIDFIGEEY